MRPSLRLRGYAVPSLIVLWINGVAVACSAPGTSNDPPNDNPASGTGGQAGGPAGTAGTPTPGASGSTTAAGGTAPANGGETASGGSSGGQAGAGGGLTMAGATSSTSGGHAGEAAGGGGGSAGNVGSSGGGGGANAAMCQMVKTEYAAELERQLNCKPGAGQQCTNRVAAAPGCDCRVFMQPTDPFAIEHLSNLGNGWYAADCSNPSCPAKCTTAAAGTCQADPKFSLGGRCVTP